MKIDQMKEGECGVIRHVGGGPDFQRRITAVGITPGSRFEIVQNIKKYPILLNIRSTMLVGTGGLTLFPGTPLLEEAQRGEFDPLSEKEMLEELKTFVENLTCDCSFITHHTVAANLTGPDFLKRKDRIVAALDHAINNEDMERLAAFRRNKRTL